MFVEKLRDAVAGAIFGVETLIGFAGSGAGSVRNRVKMAGEQQQGQRGGAGVAEIAVEEQGLTGVMARRGEGEELREGIGLKERDGRVDEVEPEIVGVSPRKVMRMVGGERAGVAERALVAGRFAGVDDGAVGGAGLAMVETANPDAGVN